MQIISKRGPRLSAVAAQFLLGIAGLAFITLVFFEVGFGLARTAFAYLILITLVSLLGSFSASIVLSLVAAACLNYFFAPPLFELRIDVPDDIERIAVFLTSSLLVTALITKARASEARFRAFVDHATDAFFLLDDRSTVLDVNRRACDSLGYSRDELIGKHRSDFDLSTDDTSVQSMKQRILAGEMVSFESCHRRKNGTSFPVEVRVSQFEQGGRRFLCLVRDVTERKQREDELRASEAKLQKAQGIAHVGWWERDFTTNGVSLSDEVCRIFGLDPVDLPEWHARWLNLIHPEDRPRAAEAAAAALLPGGPRYDVEYRVIRPDGSERTIHSQGDVTWDDSGRPLRQFGILQDITGLRLAEKGLRVAEERFRTLVQFSFDVYWESDAQHRFIRQEFAQDLADAPAPGSEIGKTRWEVPYLEPDAETWRKHRETLDAHLPFRDFELARPASDGGKRYVSVSGLPLFDKTGRFIGYRGVGRHITDRKRTEEALRRSEAYLAAAQRLSHTGTIVFNEIGPVYWSEESYRIWSLDPLHGLPDLETVMQRIHPDDRDRVRNRII